VGLSAPCCLVVGWAPLAGSAPTLGAAPGPELSLDEVGLSEEVADVGLCADVTPVLSVSCSGRMGAVAAVFPGRSVFAAPPLVLLSVLSSVLLWIGIESLPVLVGGTVGSVVVESIHRKASQQSVAVRGL
jgi:hypothetical protein